MPADSALLEGSAWPGARCGRTTRAVVVFLAFDRNMENSFTYCRPCSVWTAVRQGTALAQRPALRSRLICHREGDCQACAAACIYRACMLPLWYFERSLSEKGFAGIHALPMCQALYVSWSLHPSRLQVSSSSVVHVMARVHRPLLRKVRSQRTHTRPVRRA
ncbi:hypothetical protein CALVIDRAFT_204878 [Calocera viscosa TUFC12733]|uniref:Uncharacterized protein n=1 Tax=Calocera viscosa (strain TUFC12733) TaxID=1330018 RepID=A0A167KD54_CALVF|nr:hypothetical protein CALVIDRAFT_204878 [Calocera viscosa TUFC12733]